MKNLGVKERIIKTSSELFYSQGYNHTGINQIIEEAKVAKASMYQYFRSKEDIAVAYLKGRHIMWMGNLQQYIADKKSSKEKILAAFDYLRDWLVEVNFRGCGFQNIICDLPEDHYKIKDQVQLHKNELREMVHGLLTEANKYSETQIAELGDEIIVLIEGAIILSQIQKKTWPISSGKSACKRILN